MMGLFVIAGRRGKLYISEVVSCIREMLFSKKAENR